MNKKFCFLILYFPVKLKHDMTFLLAICLSQPACKLLLSTFCNINIIIKSVLNHLYRNFLGGSSKAQWEDVTGSTPLTFVNDCVSFTTTVSAR